MRPQRNAGENATNPDFWAIFRLRFNEAPAKCRGKLLGKPDLLRMPMRLQ